MPYSRDPNRYNDYERYAEDNRRNYHPEDFDDRQQNAHTRWRHHDASFHPQQTFRHFNNNQREWYGPHRSEPLGWRGDQAARHMPERPYWRYDQHYNQNDQHTSDRWPENQHVRERFANPHYYDNRPNRRNEEW